MKLQNADNMPFRQRPCCWHSQSESTASALADRLCLSRAVDKDGHTIDFLHRAKRDKMAVIRLFEKAMRVIRAGEQIMITWLVTATHNFSSIRKT